MATSIWKKPTGPTTAHRRSPTPPRHWIEPLSPPRPQPLEPQWSYPALTNRTDLPHQPLHTPQQRPRAQSARHTQKRGHHRTSSSTIDQLAEVALATSQSYPSDYKSSSRHNGPNGSGNRDINHGTYGASEPPHKRSRSELLPSPKVGQYASRPATSYTALPQLERDNRVEEAALLLNFRTNGWSSGNGSHTSQSPAPASVTRPHANSFPQATHQYQRPAGDTPYTSFAPPFSLAMKYEPQHFLGESKSQSKDDVRNSHDPIMTHESGESAVNLAVADAVTRQVSQPRSKMLESEIPMQSPAPSIGALSESTEAGPHHKKGWPKGRSRVSGARKSLVEKAVAKRGVGNNRKKRSTNAAKSETPASASDKDESHRRKSLSDVPVFHVAAHMPITTRASSVPRDVRMQVRDASPSKAARKNGQVASDTICAACKTARESARPNSEVDEWISCNGCHSWFHLACAGFKKAHEARDVDKYFCVHCEAEHGKTTYVRKSKRAHASVDYAELQRGVLKTSEESVEHHYIQPIKDGTFQFDPEMFPRMKPEHVTREFFEKSGAFTEPICIPAAWNPRPWAKGDHMDNGGADSTALQEISQKHRVFDEDFEYDTVPDDGQDQLEMVMPENLSVRHVANLVGPEYPLDVIDVKTQNSGSKWNLGRWADYYEEDRDEKEIRNVISLEVSHTKLGKLLKRPKIVRDIDLQDDVWPQEETDKGKWPKVQFYCLMSIADSYTDFHIDFGGSSVYYHILKGKKTFFFIPPKTKHLKAYEDWNDSPQQNYTFLPSITKECYRVDLSEGDTMLIPSGWIHAVWTPATSLVIGGNFLTRMSYKNQFRVVEIEKNNETPMKFRYPFFQRIMWYTAIKYLKEDPLPPAVSQMFYEGRRFERHHPLWADFEGELAHSDARVGAHNARYYGQAEVEGLPDLVNFIFRTVMLVMGRIEGTSADRIKRVNASIPKGHGEPLEVAKAFALWVAWKRGNEDPPAWAHPDAVLPNSKEQGAPKKLSARALKEMERKEAIAAHKSDRQSVRVINKQAAAGNASPALPSPSPKSAARAQTTATPTVASAGGGATLQTSTPQQSSISNLHPQPRAAAAEQNQHHFHHYSAHPPPPHHDMNAPPTAVMAPAQAMFMGGFPAHHLSTPKTSVLGPKRVACDTCRKRRIKCKHKDLVLQSQTNVNGSPFGADGYGHATNGEPGDMTLTPPKHQSFFGMVVDPNEHSESAQPLTDDAQANGDFLAGQGPLPGTNAYLNANIPMAMNGVPMFGDPSKRGRSKACEECRKSKRRCVHDANGNVDPVKAAESPVPRGSVAAKKKHLAEGGGESPPATKQADPQSQAPYAPMGYAPAHTSRSPSQSQMQVQHQTAPNRTPPYHQSTPVSHASSDDNNRLHSVPNNTTSQETRAMPTISQPQSQPQIYHEQHQSQLDPHLYSPYPDPDSNGPYYTNGFPYPATERPQLYNLPSLEQIASEVLDMDDKRDETTLHSDDQHLQQAVADGHHASEFMPNGVNEVDDSVDSAVSLPKSELDVPVPIQQEVETSVSNGEVQQESNVGTVPNSTKGLPQEPSANPSLPATEETRPTTSHSNLDTIPVYKPPAPVPRSPESTRKPLSNGSAIPFASPSESVKRKRDSISHPSPRLVNPKKTKTVDEVKINTELPTGPLFEDEESMTLAKVLQKEDLGLRTRIKG